MCSRNLLACALLCIETSSCHVIDMFAMHGDDDGVGQDGLANEIWSAKVEQDWCIR
jgi:hypothetical protein